MPDRCDCGAIADPETGLCESDHCVEQECTECRTVVWRLNTKCEECKAESKKARR